MDRIVQYKRHFPSYAEYQNNYKGKHNFIAKQFEEKGIVLLNLMHYKDALKAFNKSLCYSPQSANRGSLYANRAKAYMNSKMFQIALMNIELAEECGSFVLSLRKIKKICIDKINYNTSCVLSTELHDEIMQLSYDCNVTFPSIVKFIKMENDWKYGRHIIATRPMVTGDIIAMEDPFWQTMISKEHDIINAEDESCYQRCYHCFQNSSMNLIPCDTCELAMFCSIDCKTNAICDYHGIECMLPKKIKQSSGFLSIFRPLFVALSLFNGSFNDLEDFFKSNYKDCTIFELNFSDRRSLMYGKNMLLASWGLKPSFNVITSDDKYEALCHLPMFCEVWNAKKDFIKQFLQHNEKVFNGNIMLIQKWPLDVAKKISKHNVYGYYLTSPMMYKKAVGFGCFPFTSLLNHSCAPNCVSMINKSGKMVTVVIRAIPEGGQLFINYDGQSVNYFAKTPFHIRQLTLYQRHGFKCDCEACIQHNLFPTYFLNWQKNVRERELMRSLSKELMKIGPISNFNKFRQECMAIRSITNQSPTEHMCMATEIFMHYFGLISYPFFKFPEY